MKIFALGGFFRGALGPGGPVSSGGDRRRGRRHKIRRRSRPPGPRCASARREKQKNWLYSRGRLIPHPRTRKPPFVCCFTARRRLFFLFLEREPAAAAAVHQARTRPPHTIPRKDTCTAAVETAAGVHTRSTPHTHTYTRRERARLKVSSRQHPKRGGITDGAVDSAAHQRYRDYNPYAQVYNVHNNLHAR